MPLQWKCPKGHRWPAAQTDATLPVGGKSVYKKGATPAPPCPVCGSKKGTMVDGPALPSDNTLKPVGTPDLTLDALTRPQVPPPTVGATPVRLNDNVGNNDETLPPPITSQDATQALTSAPPSASDETRAFPPAATSASTQPVQTDGSAASDETRAFTPDATDTGATQAMNPPAASPEGATRVQPGDRQQGGKKDAAASVSGYEILGVLGRGGMGVVYKARQIGLNRLCALKMVLSGSHASPEDLLRFQIEAQAVAKLQHANIVQIYEVGERDGHPFFSLEFVDGGTLQKKMEGKPMPPEKAATLIEALARAIHYAHQRGIIHRDLKPANVLLTTDGIAKITDFGLAKSLGDESHQTGTGAIMGTPSYMAPEQAMGKTREIGIPADIYSLGAILYDTLTGRPPFCGQTVLDTLQQVKHDEPVPPRRLISKVPVDLETICLKCLEKEPAKRYATAEAFADDLGRFLRGEPIQARPITTLERVMKWAKRRPAVAALLGLLAFVLVGGFTMMFILWMQAEVARSLAQASEQKAKESEALALDNETKAIAAKHVADAAKNQAEIEEKKAKANFERANRTLFAANMNLAQSAYHNAQAQRLWELLQGDGPASDNPKLRGFEWNYLWNLYHSDRLALKSHTQLVHRIAFMPPYGRIVASASADGTVVLWDTSNPEETKYRFFRGHRGPVRAVAFGGNGRWLASAGEDNFIFVWDLKSSADVLPRKLTGHKDWVHALAFSPDGTRLASAGEDRTIRVWDMSNGSQTALLEGHLYGVSDVAFSPDGTTLASASKDRTVRVWNIAKQKEIFFPLAHGHWVSAVAISSDGKYLASGGWENKVRVWYLGNGEPAFDLEGLTSPVQNLDFGAGNQRLASSSRDQSVTVWDLVTQKLIRNLPPEPGLVRSVSFSPDGQLLASVNFDQLTQEALARQADHPILAVAFALDAQHVAGASTAGNLLLWNLADKESARKLDNQSGPLHALAFSPPRKEWAVAGEDGMIHLWSASGEKLKSFKAHDRWILALAYSPDGKHLASASADHTIALWTLGSAQKPTVLQGHTRPVRALAFNVDGSLLASGGADHTVRLWNAHSGEARAAFQARHEGPVTAVAFHPQDGSLASAGWDRLIKIWDPATGKLLSELRGHTQGVTALAFSQPDGQRLASGSEDRTIKIWDLATGQETLTLAGHTQGITSLAFSPSGARLVSAGWDGAVRIWTADAPRK